MPKFLLTRGVRGAWNRAAPAAHAVPAECLFRSPPGSLLIKGLRAGQVLKQRLRRTLFPKVASGQRCGHCLNCRVPSRKQACSTRRAEMLAQGLALMAETLPGAEQLASLVQHRKLTKAG